MESVSLGPGIGPMTTIWQVWDARLRQPGPSHVRTDHPDGSKRIAWRTEDGVSGIGDHDMADLLYVDRLPMAARVVVTEGEKACDAVRAVGHDAVATVCGSGATPGQAVIDLFLGSRVTLWPDADPSGWDHMRRLAVELEPVVASLRLVDVPADAPRGWDAADATRGQIRRLIHAAHDVWLRR